MIKTSFELQGAEALNAKLKIINEDLQRKGGRAALRKAANIIRDVAKRNARYLDDPNTSESISANIVTRWSSKRFKRTGDLGFRIGVLGGAKGAAVASREFSGKGKGNPGGDTFYWRFLEFGTVNQPAVPFMRNALQQNISKATSEFVKQYNKSIDRAIKRASKK